jgi:hypothetical protein
MIKTKLLRKRILERIPYLYMMYLNPFPGFPIMLVTGTLTLSKVTKVVPLPQDPLSN